MLVDLLILAGLISAIAWAVWAGTLDQAGVQTPRGPFGELWLLAPFYRKRPAGLRRVGLYETLQMKHRELNDRSMLLGDAVGGYVDTGFTEREYEALGLADNDRFIFETGVILRDAERAQAHEHQPEKQAAWRRLTQVRVIPIFDPDTDDRLGDVRVCTYCGEAFCLENNPHGCPKRFTDRARIAL